MLMTETSIEAVLIEALTSAIALPAFKCVLYIYYPIQFKEKQAKLKALLDSSNEVNTLISACATSLGLKFCPTNVKAQKIDSSTFETFEIVLANFQIEDKLGKAWLF